MDSLINQLIDAAQQHPYWVYGLIFADAIPHGPLLTIACGYLSAMGLLNPLVVYVLVVVGDVIGDALFYSLGRFGWRVKSLRAFATKLGVTQEKLNDFSSHFNTKTVLFLMVSKYFYGPGLAGLVYAGASKLPYTKYMPMCLVLSMAQSTVLLSLGYLAQGTYTIAAHYLNVYVSVCIGLAAVCALGKLLKILLTKLGLPLFKIKVS